MVDFDMDCDQTEDGWFEVKGLIDQVAIQWEADVVQVRIRIPHQMLICGEGENIFFFRK